MICGAGPPPPEFRTAHGAACATAWRNVPLVNARPHRGRRAGCFGIALRLLQDGFSSSALSSASAAPPRWRLTLCRAGGDPRHRRYRRRRGHALSPEPAGDGGGALVTNGHLSLHLHRQLRAGALARATGSRKQSGKPGTLVGNMILAFVMARSRCRGLGHRPLIRSEKRGQVIASRHACAASGTAASR